MYNKYFGLEESPFSIAPDPRYLYMSEQHREALAHLVYGFNSDGGFVLLTGEVGTGKTTVCRCLLEQIPENSSIALIINPKLTVEELLATICDEFGIKYPEINTSIKTFVDLINGYLLDTHSKGRKSVLIIDEAQNLSSEVLEQLRLLTNLETNQRKLLQIILLGQPELRDKLSRPELRQLSQRIIARYHLDSLSRKDVGAYVAHRLSVAGLQNQIFPDSTINKLYKLSGGIPRLINVLCDRALLGTFVQEQSSVNTSTLSKAAGEVFGKSGRQNYYRRVSAWIVTVLFIIAVGAVLAAAYFKNESRQSVTQNTEETPAVEPAPLDNLQWPDNQPINLSNQMAFQGLFKQWGITYLPEKNTSVCLQAQKQGLRCLNGLGSLNNLLHLNRPSVLKLYDEKKRKFYATLIALKKDSAVFIVGTDTREVSIKDIESQWLGSYTLLWRVPPDYKSAVYPGVQDPVVQWLDKQLALVQGEEVQQRENTKFDDDLVNRIKKFQIAEGLIPDGIVGTQTLIRLNSTVSADTPKLTVKQEDK
ncbi:MAG: AAA family ATPase [Thermodesulfovibrionia bacterium]|nr:AAA family ATPase [Thermodesulfovibrionia bacterium]